MKNFLSCNSNPVCNVSVGMALSIILAACGGGEPGATQTSTQTSTQTLASTTVSDGAADAASVPGADSGPVAEPGLDAASARVLEASAQSAPLLAAAPQVSHDYQYYHAYGDSVTWGATLANPGAESYPALVAKAKSLSLSNYGIPGAQSCDIATREIFPHADQPSLAKAGLYTLVIGTNDGTGAYEAVFNKCQRAAIAWLAIPLENKLLATDSAVTSEGATVLETANRWNALTTQAQGASISLPFTRTTEGAVYLWYRLKDGTPARFRYGLDGHGLGSVTVATRPAMHTWLGSDNSMGMVRLASVAPGAHVLKVTQLNPETDGVGIIGLGLAPDAITAAMPTVMVGAIPKQLTYGDPCAKCDIYAAHIRSNVSLLANDGLNVVFFQTRKYMLGTTADMSDVLHPNALGHSEMAHALFDRLP